MFMRVRRQIGAVGITFTLTAILLSVSTAQGAASALEGEKVKMAPATPVERQWRHWGNKRGVEYYGTFDHVTALRAQNCAIDGA